MGPLTGTPEQYALEMGELWSGLTRTLGRLDRLAAEPDGLDADALRRLQYRLHLAAEHVYGVHPPAAAASAHAELAASLACARDATAEVVEALDEQGPDGVAPLLHEWRGLLFCVRLARLRLALPVAQRAHVEPADSDGIARPLAAFLLALGGALAFVAGAVLGEWPLWATGVAAVCGSVLVYRP